MHIRIQSFALILCAFVTTSCADADNPTKQDPDLARLRGQWKSVSWVIAGREENDYRKRNTFRISGTTHTFFLDGKKQGTGTIKIDSSKTPCQIDLTYNGGPMNGKTLLGIYRFNKQGRYITCFAQAGDARPTEFKSTPDNKYFLSTDQRIGEPGEPSDAPESR